MKTQPVAVPALVKSAAVRPDTASENVRLKVSGRLVIGEVAAVDIPETLGAVKSLVRVVEGPGVAFPAASTS